ncbi:hypothetical protein TVNIR_1552 [Thioalkalivibrio nitratireducens DSM 14787]|uniref:Uncharacterized protein n=1 Tax=Thioalkalivibrio nitratireducens (strain DSM 14787 / UNIQEM 213 / ALEN2) TaxID=1255043 RepID=L0DW66_THIND|nr:hypothetical protein TVNIR_1552 [Thioalkalivibrio nitratireducens DSM 14787]
MAPISDHLDRGVHHVVRRTAIDGAVDQVPARPVEGDVHFPGRRRTMRPPRPN